MEPQNQNNASKPASSMFEVHTPVAGLNYATLLNRFIAVIIDAIILSIASVILALPLGIILGAFFVIGTAATGNGNASIAVGGVLFFVLFVVIDILYFAYFESSKYQGTFGKVIMKLKVADVNGERLSFKHAVKRNILKNASAVVLLMDWVLGTSLYGIVNLAWIAINAYFIYSDANKQSIYDRYANTVVLNA